MKFEFVFRPGADPEDVLMKFSGAEDVEVIDQLGVLVVTSSIGNYVLPNPKVFSIDTVGNAVELSWQPEWDISVTGDTARFVNIASYDTTQTLVFRMGEELFSAADYEQGNLVWSTYYGGNLEDEVNDLDVDEDGNLFSVGTSRSLFTSFPTLNTEYDVNEGANAIAFIGKIQPYGITEWMTFYGSGFSLGNGIAVGNNESVYVTGEYINQFFQSGDSWFPIVDFHGDSYTFDAATPGGAPHSFGFMLRLNQDDGESSWATLYGDDAGDCVGKKLAINQFNGNVYVVGDARKSDNFPIFRESWNTSAHQLGNLNENLGFVAAFDSDNKLIWSTLFGSEGTRINDVCIGAGREDILITGSVASSDYMDFETESQIDQIEQPWGGGNSDAFVAQFDGLDYELVWSTFLGGSGTESGTAITYNQHNGSLYVCGGTNSEDDFPTESNLNGSSINHSTLNGSSDGFITRYPWEDEMDWSTYFGGGGADIIYDVGVGQFGNIFLVGLTEGDGYQDEQMTGGYYQEDLENTVGDGLHGDAFFVGLNTGDDLTWSTYFGGETYYEIDDNGIDISSEDAAKALAVSSENLFIGGYTESNTDFPLEVDLLNYPSAYWNFENSSAATSFTDGFFAQFVLSDTPLSVDELRFDDDGMITVYPNPTEDILNIDIHGQQGPFLIEMYDAVGKQVFGETSGGSAKNQSIRIYIGQLSKGLYLLSVSSNEIKQRGIRVIVN